ncbi:MAG: M23 family metallopeptidase [Desulfobulbaceae bacterium]|nr:M23 family metallopeptidase [Desulfobulbaceae bacterium]
MSSQTRFKTGGPKKSKSNIGRIFILFLLLIIIAAGAMAVIILFETEKPLVTLKTDIKYLGRKTTIPFQVTDRKQGLRSVAVTIEQNGRSMELFQEKFQRKTWFYGAGPSETEGVAEFDNSKVKLKDGEADLVVTARDFSLNGFLKGNTVTGRYPVVIDTKMPRVTLEHTQRYILPGGSGIVVYDLSEPSERNGVEVNGDFFTGYPMPNRENRYVAYIALDWDADKIESSRAVATDMAGNEGQAVFSMTLKQADYKKDQINVSDGFLNSKVPEFEQYYPEMKGSMLDKYLFTNNEVRKRNAETIKKLCGTSEPNRLWVDRFLRMSGASKAGFADLRTYYYQGQAIDKQVHLGMDIASTAAVEIKAANRGKVIFADYLGIYGNTIILDHGQGVFSLYSHLSRIETEVDEVVDQGAIIGRSGATGMAGGDHLHFSMMIQGKFVTPVEWWDQHWIDVNINDILDQF